MNVRGERVARNFSRSAETYDASAMFQRRAADQLLAALDRSPAAVETILEIGCGTGFVTAKLLERFPRSALLACDISAAMLARCRRNLSSLLRARRGPVTFLRNDFDETVPEGDFDLVVSGLTFQWVSDLPRTLATIERRLHPGGRLVFSTMGEETFAAVRRFFKDFDVSFPVPELRSAAAVRRACSMFGAVEITETFEEMTFTSMRSFLEHLRQTGAVNATGKTMGIGDLRKVLRRWDGESNQSAPVKAVHHVLLADCSKESGTSSDRGGGEGLPFLNPDLSP